MAIDFMLFAFLIGEYSYQQEEGQEELGNTPRLWWVPQHWKTFEDQQGPWEFQRGYC